MDKVIIGHAYRRKAQQALTLPSDGIASVLNSIALNGAKLTKDVRGMVTSAKEDALKFIKDQTPVVERLLKVNVDVKKGTVKRYPATSLFGKKANLSGAEFDIRLYISSLAYALFSSKTVTGIRMCDFLATSEFIQSAEDGSTLYRKPGQIFQAIKDGTINTKIIEDTMSEYENVFENVTEPFDESKSGIIYRLSSLLVDNFAANKICEGVDFTRETYSLMLVATLCAQLLTSFTASGIRSLELTLAAFATEQLPTFITPTNFISVIMKLVAVDQTNRLIERLSKQLGNFSLAFDDVFKFDSKTQSFALKTQLPENIFVTYISGQIEAMLETIGLYAHLVDRLSLLSTFTQHEVLKAVISDSDVSSDIKLLFGFTHNTTHVSEVFDISHDEIVTRDKQYAELDMDGLIQLVMSLITTYYENVADFSDVVSVSTDCHYDGNGNAFIHSLWFEPPAVHQNYLVDVLGRFKKPDAVTEKFTTGFEKIRWSETTHAVRYHSLSNVDGEVTVRPEISRKDLDATCENHLFRQNGYKSDYFNLGTSVVNCRGDVGDLRLALWLIGRGWVFNRDRGARCTSIKPMNSLLVVTPPARANNLTYFGKSIGDKFAKDAAHFSYELKDTSVNLNSFSIPELLLAFPTSAIGTISALSIDEIDKQCRSLYVNRVVKLTSAMLSEKKFFRPKIKQWTRWTRPFLGLDVFASHSKTKSSVLDYIARQTAVQPALPTTCNIFKEVSKNVNFIIPRRFSFVRDRQIVVKLPTDWLSLELLEYLSVNKTTVFETAKNALGKPTVSICVAASDATLTFNLDMYADVTYLNPITLSNEDGVEKITTTGRYNVASIDGVDPSVKQLICTDNGVVDPKEFILRVPAGVDLGETRLNMCLGLLKHLVTAFTIKKLANITEHIDESICLAEVKALADWLSNVYDPGLDLGFTGLVKNGTNVNALIQNLAKMTTAKDAGNVLSLFNISANDMKYVTELGIFAVDFIDKYTAGVSELVTKDIREFLLPPVCIDSLSLDLTELLNAQIEPHVKHLILNELKVTN